MCRYIESTIVEIPARGATDRVADGGWCEVLGRAGTGLAVGGKLRETLLQVATWTLLEADSKGGEPVPWTAKSSEALQQTGRKKLEVEDMRFCS